jgi:DNA-binding MarR family transcriptional regulator
MEQDSVDRHIEHWQREIPELDPVGEGVMTRMEILLRHLTLARQAVLAGHGLVDSEFHTLHFLAGCGPPHRATPGEIAAWQRMSPSGVTGRLDALEKRGFIRRLPAPADRRKVIIELTGEGRQAWRGVIDPMCHEELKMLAGLDPGEREQLNNLLRTMMQAVDRPGLLSLPESSAPGNAAAKPRARFTQQEA